ncbi:MAG: hypothetical protein A2W85_05345 [Bacteroidetes bacterium GWF2_41_31]|nr:MAG: hypothetical protein A2W85_05345 [Bacteroidetes bacterium GWF2_41_31]
MKSNHTFDRKMSEKKEHKHPTNNIRKPGDVVNLNFCTPAFRMGRFTQNCNFDRLELRNPILRILQTIISKHILMMKIIVFLTLFFPMFLHGQRIGPYVNRYSKNQVVKKIEKGIQRNTSQTIKINLEEVGDTLNYRVTENELTTVIKMTFNLKNNYCDYQEISTTCGECAEKRGKSLFSRFKWYRISDTKYVSRYYRKIMLELIDNPPSDFCNTIKFQYNSMTEMEYKEAIHNFQLLNSN